MISVKLCSCQLHAWEQKVSLSAEETLVFMFEWMKCSPGYNPKLLSSSSFKMESCALRHVMCNQWWDSEVRQQEVNQVLTGQSSQVSGNAGRRMMHAKKEEKEIKRKRMKEYSSLYYLSIYLNSINLNSPYVFIYILWIYSNSEQYLYRVARVHSPTEGASRCDTIRQNWCFQSRQLCWI